ncbi:MAG: holo-ACP synthase [Clostridia bacterium]|nr:holo-ACP synthase [Clostridia bacterium]
MRVLCGTDIVEIKRMLKHIALKEDGSYPSFITKCFTPNEIEYCMGKKLDSKKAESLAGRYAAKEAASKALGTGLMTEGIGFLDFEIILDDKGAPHLELHGRALEVANNLGVVSKSISISHDGEYAISYCTLLSEGEEN